MQSYISYNIIVANFIRCKKYFDPVCLEVSKRTLSVIIEAISKLIDLQPLIKNSRVNTASPQCLEYFSYYTKYLLNIEKSNESVIKNTQKHIVDIQATMKQDITVYRNSINEIIKENESLKSEIQRVELEISRNKESIMKITDQKESYKLVVSKREVPEIVDEKPQPSQMQFALKRKIDELKEIINIEEEERKIIFYYHHSFHDDLEAILPDEIKSILDWNITDDRHLLSFMVDNSIYLISEIKESTVQISDTIRIIVCSSEKQKCTNQRYTQFNDLQEVSDYLRNCLNEKITKLRMMKITLNNLSSIQYQGESISSIFRKNAPVESYSFVKPEPTLLNQKFLQYENLNKELNEMKSHLEEKVIRNNKIINDLEMKEINYKYTKISMEREQNDLLDHLQSFLDFNCFLQSVISNIKVDHNSVLHMVQTISKNSKGQNNKVSKDDLANTTTQLINYYCQARTSLSKIII